MAKSEAKRKQGRAHPVVARRKGWQRHLDALGMNTPREYREWCRAQGFATSLHKTWWEREQEARRAERTAARQNAHRAQARHLRELGFTGQEEYDAWCERNNFGVSPGKSEAQRAKETEARQQERAEQALSMARQRHNTPDALIMAIYEGRAVLSATPTAVEWKIQMLFMTVKDRIRAREALRDLFLCVCRAPALLSVEPAIPYFGPAQGNTYLDGLLQLALRWRAWKRPLADWKPQARRARDLFGSLARHLLTDYPVPAFLDAVWFQGGGPQASERQEWFLHLGAGGNIRTAQNVPLPLTSMAAHHFLRAPREMSVTAAMRWGQALGMRGSRRLAQAVAASRLRDPQQDEAFWTTVVQFFVNHSSLDVTRIAPIIDYIHHQRFEPMVVVNAEGEEVSASPPNPNFSMKGRAPTALLRQVEEWHRQLADMAKRPAQQWVASTIRPLNLTMQSATTGDVTFWTTRELLSSKELEEEGRAMHNCVATYTRDCLHGESAIWSLRAWTPQDPVPRRVMTIEICPETRAIVQARGKCNHCASEPRAVPRLKAGLEALRHWAKQEQMTLSPGAL